MTVHQVLRVYKCQKYYLELTNKITRALGILIGEIAGITCKHYFGFTQFISLETFLSSFRGEFSKSNICLENEWWKFFTRLPFALLEIL